MRGFSGSKGGVWWEENERLTQKDMDRWHYALDLVDAEVKRLAEDWNTWRKMKTNLLTQKMAYELIVRLLVLLL